MYQLLVGNLRNINKNLVCEIDRITSFYEQPK